jgi:4-oxalocrotonate tautomerase
VPFVTIEWFEGRSDEQKREIAERVTSALAEVGELPLDQVWIRFVDASRADWAIGGEIQGERPSGGDPALGPPD